MISSFGQTRDDRKSTHVNSLHSSSLIIIIAASLNDILLFRMPVKIQYRWLRIRTKPQYWPNVYCADEPEEFIHSRKCLRFSTLPVIVIFTESPKNRFIHEMRIDQHKIFYIVWCVASDWHTFLVGIFTKPSFGFFSCVIQIPWEIFQKRKKKQI